MSDLDRVSDARQYVNTATQNLNSAASVVDIVLRDNPESKISDRLKQISALLWALEDKARGYEHVLAEVHAMLRREQR
jgi:hypothetical protein